MARYNCILLDLDGTVLNFEASEQIALEKTLEHFELPNTVQVTDTYKKINNELWREFEKGEIKKEVLVNVRWEKLFIHLDKTGDYKKVNDFYFSILSQYGVAYPDAKEFLEEIAEVATIAAATNGVERVQKSRLASSGIAVYMDEIFVSEKIGAVKPSAKFFNVAIDKLGITNLSKVLVVGDSLNADIKGGINAKLDTCWVNFNEIENPTNINPKYVVTDYEQLKDIIYGEEGKPVAKDKQKTS